MAILIILYILSKSRAINASAALVSLDIVALLDKDALEQLRENHRFRAAGVDEATLSFKKTL